MLKECERYERLRFGSADCLLISLLSVPTFIFISESDRFRQTAKRDEVGSRKVVNGMVRNYYEKGQRNLLGSNLPMTTT